MMLIRKEHVILVAGKPSYLAVCFPDVSQIGVPLPADISPQPCLGPVTTTIQLVFLSLKTSIVKITSTVINFYILILILSFPAIDY